MNLFAAFTAFSLGALHALEPGHGKSAIAAYAVGYRSRLGHILFLGLSTALAHTITILVLALILGAAISSVASETSQIYIQVISSALMIGTGLWLWRRSRQTDKAAHETHCSCPNHQHEHDKPVSYGVIGLLGISTGLLPCPTALAVLLSSIATGEMKQGLLTVILFSVGISLTMCAIACAALFFARSRYAERLRNLAGGSRLAGMLPVLSSLIIILSGVFSLVRTFSSSN